MNTVIACGVRPGFNRFMEKISGLFIFTSLETFTRKKNKSFTCSICTGRIVNQRHNQLLSFFKGFGGIKKRNSQF